MDDIDAMIELILQMDAEQKRFAKAFPGLLTEEAQKMREAVLKELRVVVDGHLRELCAANEVAGKAQSENAAAYIERKADKFALSYHDHFLAAAKAQGDAQTRDLSARFLAVEEIVSSALSHERQMRDSSDKRVKELAANMQAISAQGSAPDQAFIAAFKGTLTSESVFKRGELWAYRGGCYLAQKDGKGELPTRENQKKPDPIWSLIAAPGAPAAPVNTFAGSQAPGLNSYHATANSAGNSVVTASASTHTEVVTVTGLARTSVFSVPITGHQAGDVCTIRFVNPATAAIVLEIRNSTVGGTLLYSYTTDGSGTDNLTCELIFNGTAWGPLINAGNVV